MGGYNGAQCVTALGHCVFPLAAAPRSSLESRFYSSASTLSPIMNSASPENILLYLPPAQEQTINDVFAELATRGFPQ